MSINKHIKNVEEVMTRCNTEFKVVWARKLEQLLELRRVRAHERLQSNARSVC